MKANNKAHRLERILTLAGLTLIVVACIANLYGAYTNQRFIHDLIDVIYYFRYVILLGGGFAVGYLLTKKVTQYNRLFMGVAYAILTMALFLVIDFTFVGLQRLFGVSAYPLGKMVFMGAPLLSLMTSLAIAYFSQHKSNRSSLSPFTKFVIIVSFIIYQVYVLAGSVYYLTFATAAANQQSIWVILGSYLLTPLVIAAVSYFVLNKLKKRFDKLFYAIVIGIFYSILALVLWEFRTDASSEATNIFSTVVTTLTIFFAGIILWRVHKALA